MLILLVFQIFFSYLKSQGLAPLNPEYIAYTGEYESLKKSSQSNSGGFIPHSFVFNYDNLREQSETYDLEPIYDLRKKGWVTSVKNQGNCGACWAFATMAALESNWLKFKNVTYDLSEQHLRTCHGFEWTPCQGGGPHMSAAYFSRFQGPVTENSSVYNTNATASCFDNLPLFAYVADTRFISNDRNAVKKAILDYGGVTACFFWNDSLFNPDNNTYYFNGKNVTNHLILLAGWDDTKITKGGVGAWIVKNSYGSSWGEKGYFYIAYQDSKILTEISFFPTTVWNPTFSIFGYDKLGMTNSFGGWGDYTAFGLTVFKASAKQKVVSVGTYVNTANAKIDISIFHKFKNGKLTDTLSCYSQTCNLPGYYTFNLKKSFIINRNDSFYVRVKYSTPKYDYPIPVEYPNEKSNPVIFSNVNWIGHDGCTWIPAESKNLNLCIKYAAVLLETNSVESMEKSGELSVYPNPVNDQLKIEYLQGRKLDISVFNIAGQLVLLKKLDTDVRDFDISHLSKGIYFVKLFDGEKYLTQKIVKE
jgi:C1A family cysteine protease